MPDEECRALRDKANVALGFAALKDGQPQDARNYLQRVRLRRHRGQRRRCSASAGPPTR